VDELQMEDCSPLLSCSMPKSDAQRQAQYHQLSLEYAQLDREYNLQQHVLKEIADKRRAKLDAMKSLARRIPVIDLVCPFGLQLYFYYKFL
jgi:hypothetical protein